MNRLKTIIFFILLFNVSELRAQLCQGSLGDPIVNISFGSGSNPGAPLQAAVTTYLYNNSDCPADGEYTVRNKTDNCFSNNWHTLSSDHTGNPGGYFMLVNASYQPSAFYVDTVNLFCSNTTYEFAAWIINMLRSFNCSGNPSIEPNLTFSIEKTDGTLLQSYNTGNIPVQPVATWNQYGFFFTAPPGVTRIVLRITNNAPGGCGNDLALDDITFRPCGPQLSVSIVGSGSSTAFCQGQINQLSLSATLAAGYSNPYFQWQQSNNNGSSWTDIPGANSTLLIQNFNNTSSAGTYLYRLSVSKMENNTVLLCRVNSGVLTVKVNAKPVIGLISNSPVCEDASITLSTTGNDSYQWIGPNSYSSNSASVNLPGAQTNQSGKYLVQATTGAGCTSMDSTIVIINPRPHAFVDPDTISFCEGNVITLNASGGSSYLWQPASGLSSSSIASPVAAPKDSIIYKVIVSNSFFCSDTAFVQINVFKKPVANAGVDMELIEGDAANLEGFASGTNISFLWTPDYAIDDVNQLHTSVHPAVDTAYILKVQSNSGCGNANDTVKIKVYKGLYIPTAFTPNSDGLNDQWIIPGLGAYKTHELTVFNRYGQIVFDTKNNQPWNGKLNGKDLPVGVYVYTLRVKNKNLMWKGTVTIIR